MDRQVWEGGSVRRGRSSTLGESGTVAPLPFAEGLRAARRPSLSAETHCSWNLQACCVLLRRFYLFWACPKEHVQRSTRSQREPAQTNEGRPIAVFAAAPLGIARRLEVFPTGGSSPSACTHLFPSFTLRSPIPFNRLTTKPDHPAWLNTSHPSWFCTCSPSWTAPLRSGSTRSSRVRTFAGPGVRSRWRDSFGLTNWLAEGVRSTGRLDSWQR